MVDVAMWVLNVGVDEADVSVECWWWL